MDPDPRDLTRVLQSDVLPGEPAVRRLPDPVSVRDVSADRRLPHPDVDDVRVRLRDRDRPDRPRLEVLVRNVLPVRPAVRRLPDSSPRSPEIEGQRVMPPPRDGNRPSSPIRTDAPH